MFTLPASEWCFYEQKFCKFCALTNCNEIQIPHCHDNAQQSYSELRFNMPFINIVLMSKKKLIKAFELLFIKKLLSFYLFKSYCVLFKR